MNNEKLQSLSSIFLEADGILSQILPYFEVRPQQSKLCDFLEENLDKGINCIAEAGTGIGKSFAYLIPSLKYALDNDCKIIVSTKTIALQNQLLTKDIPIIQQAFAKIGYGFQAALGKGRRNYACINKYRQTLQQALFKETAASQQYAAFSQWLLSTETGDRSEIGFPVDKIWPEMCADHIDCLERHCPDYNRCFVQKQRIRLNQADLLVINHALLFSDFALRQNGAGGILPDCSLIVMDEAHHLEEIAQSNLGQRLTVYDLQRLLIRPSQRKEGFWAKINSQQETKNEVNRFHQILRPQMQDLFADAEALLQHNRSYRFMQPVLSGDLAENLTDYHDYLQNASAGMNLTEEDEAELAVYQRQLQDIICTLSDFQHLTNNHNTVYWAEKINDSIVLNSVPLQLTPMLQALWQEKLCIFTSATLSINNSFDTFIESLGLSDCRHLLLDSPFNYRRNALLLVPPSVIEPRQETQYNQYVADKITEILSITMGQTLVLFTSIRQLDTVAELTSAVITKQLGLNLLLQGTLSREILLQQFADTPSSVLFGLDTFWEGIDIPGNSLTCIIMTKLPFPAPGAPVLEARSELLDQQGRNPFLELSLPKAVIKFKQGFGRLIRSSSDRGVVVVLDDRLTRRKYKQAFLGSIPKTGRSRSLQDIARYLLQNPEHNHCADNIANDDISNDPAD